MPVAVAQRSRPYQSWLSSCSTPFRHLNPRRAQPQRRINFSRIINDWQSRRSGNRSLAMPRDSDGDDSFHSLTNPATSVALHNIHAISLIAVQSHGQSPKAHDHQTECRSDDHQESRPPTSVHQDVKVVLPTTEINGIASQAAIPEEVTATATDAAASLATLATLEEGLEPSAYARAALNRRKRALVDSLMAFVEQWLETRLGPMEEACDADGSPSGKGSRARKGNTGRTGQKASGQKRQLPCEDEDGSLEEEGDGNDDDRKKRLKIEIREVCLKLACPYFKRDPVKFGACRTCPGPGWESIHRLKEHLYRRHALPRFKCKRCYALFTEEKDLDEHQRSETPCVLTKVEPFIDPVEGFNKDQETKIKARKPQKSESERVELWREIYCILFFVDPSSADIPTPYYDHLQAAQLTSRPTDLPEQCVRYLRREFPALIRRQLEAELDKQMSGVEERTMELLDGIMQASWLNLINTYEAIAPPDAALTANPQSPREEVPLLGESAEDFGLSVGFPGQAGGVYEPFDFGALVGQYDFGVSGQMSLGSSTDGSMSSASLYPSYASNTSIEFERQTSPSDVLALGDEGVSLDLVSKAPAQSSGGIDGQKIAL